MFKMQLEGLDALRIKLRRLEDWPTIAESIIEKHLVIIVETAKVLAPVDTGFMRDNIRTLGAKISQDVIGGEILSAAEYSSFVEYGTKFQTAQPHLRPAVERRIEGLIEDLVRAIDKIFE